MTDQNAIYVEHLYKNIYISCEENLYSNDARSSTQARRILSVANVFYNNALRILRKQSSLIYQNNQQIQFKQNIIFLEKMLDIVTEFVPFYEKDNNVAKLIDPLYFSHKFFRKSTMRNCS